MIILGIDPGLAITGFGVISHEQNHFQVIQYGVIRTPSQAPLPERLVKIREGVQLLIDKYHPDCAAIEELFFNTNAKSAFLVGQARGVAVVTAAAAGLPVYEYTPLQVKQGVTGYGRADKQQMQQMVKTLLHLKETPKPDDAADALAIAMCHAHAGHFQQLFSV